VLLNDKQAKDKNVKHARADKHKYTAEKVKSSLRERGVHIRTLTRGGIVQETPELYKEVDIVADVSHNLGIGTKVARLVPRGVIKG
jgi:tRNA-splicing ligase RtcB (3'-phosphate/5'-hydroxy nucleic acid ligase)